MKLFQLRFRLYSPYGFPRQSLLYASSYPILESFDGSSDPREYVMHYHNAMTPLCIPEEKCEAMIFKNVCLKSKRGCTIVV